MNERVYQIILDRLLSGKVAAGQRLDPEDLCADLGVSRTPVKEAINRLAAEGLVEVTPRRGTMVTTLTLGDVDEMFDVRKMIEVHAAELALRNATSEDCSRLWSRLEKLRSFVVGDEYTDFLAFLTKDNEMHSFLVSLAGNRRLSALYDSAKLHIRFARLAFGQSGHRMRDAEATYQEHVAIATAFEAGSLVDLRVALSQHIDNRLASFRRALSS